MTAPFSDEISAFLARAEQSINAARELADKGFPDFAASRAYYAAFYAAKALTLREGCELVKHSAVIAAIHRDYVKPGRLDPALGKKLNWLFELRGTGDYGVMEHVSPPEADEAIIAAGEFVDAVRGFFRAR